MNETPTRSPEPGPPSPGGSGLAPNVAGALSYLLGALTGVLFLVIDKERPFIRFHAMQSIVFTVAWIALWIVLFILGLVLGVIPVIGFLLDLLITLVVMVVGFVLWLYLMYQAFQGNEWEIPFIGEQARRLMPQVTPPGSP